MASHYGEAPAAAGIRRRRGNLLFYACAKADSKLQWPACSRAHHLRNQATLLDFDQNGLVI